MFRPHPPLLALLIVTAHVTHTLLGIGSEAIEAALLNAASHARP